MPSAGSESSDVPGTAGLPDPAGQGAAGLSPDTLTLIDQLNTDRLWLLRQLDSGRWGEWRLDLAALERELGQLLDQVRETQST